LQYTPLIPTEPPLAGCIEALFVLDDYCPEHPREHIVPDDAPSSVRGAVSRLLESPRDVAIADLVDDESDVSHRHLVDLFKRHVGPTPKRLQRILRFHGVFGKIQAAEAVDWAQLSRDLGYAGQSHFVRDFVAFSGFRYGDAAGALAEARELLRDGAGSFDREARMLSARALARLDRPEEALEEAALLRFARRNWTDNACGNARRPHTSSRRSARPGNGARHGGVSVGCSW
jgi:AraC-like DNA-binding protein